MVSVWRGGRGARRGGRGAQTSHLMFLAQERVPGFTEILFCFSCFLSLFSKPTFGMMICNRQNGPPFKGQLAGGPGFSMK